MEQHKILIIGAGGITSYLLPCLTKTSKPNQVVIYDGDNLERRNLRRQASFNDLDVNNNKAQILGEKFGTNYVPEFFHENNCQHKPKYILCCADNNAARVSAQIYAQRHNSTLIIGANEYESAEAYAWHTKTGLPKPTKFYPELLEADDSPEQALGCDHQETIKQHEQLPIANMVAASFMLALFHTIKNLPDIRELAYIKNHHLSNLLSTNSQSWNT